MVFLLHQQPITVCSCRAWKPDCSGYTSHKCNSFFRHYVTQRSPTFYAKLLMCGLFDCGLRNDKLWLHSATRWTCAQTNFALLDVLFSFSWALKAVKLSVWAATTRWRHHLVLLPVSCTSCPSFCVIFPYTVPRTKHVRALITDESGAFPKQHWSGTLNTLQSQAVLLCTATVLRSRNTLNELSLELSWYHLLKSFWFVNKVAIMCRSDLFWDQQHFVSRCCSHRDREFLSGQRGEFNS